MLEVQIRNLTKSYTPGQPVLKPLNLTVGAGERFFLLGPSGCGKSTLLRIIAGLLEPDGGRILFNGVDVTDLTPEARCAPMVFQNYALWPNMTVAENVAFGLRASGKYRAAEREIRVRQALDTVQMTELANRKPGALSGGQQQRVALARCLALEPGVLLLDEPLSNLDARLRDQMRLELARLCRERQLTTIYVTHDRKEALSMADQVAVLHDGVLQQVGAPIEVYRRPVNRFVAGFLGDADFIDGVYRGGGQVEALDTLFTLARIPSGVAAGQRVTLFVRPEAVRFGRSEVNQFQAVLREGQFMGESMRWEFEGGLTVSEAAAPARRPGETCELTVAPDQLHLLTE